MNSVYLITLSITLLVTIVSINGLGTYDEACTIQTGNGVSVDSCDASKHLACTNGRCQCSDPRNQIYHYRLVETNDSRSRSKRGTKKKIAIGVGAAAVGVYAGSKLAKGGSSKKKEFKRVYSCYSRVGGQCVLGFNNVKIITTSSTTTTTSTTTTPAPSTNADNSTSSTTSTTTSAPTPQAQVFDISAIPNCVPFASCNMNSNSTDPRVGLCQCDSGFTNTKSDICVKSGVDKLSMNVLCILFSILFTKILM